jgi:chromosome segregation ATPase
MSVAEEHRRVLADALALADREIGELRARLADAEQRERASTAALAAARERAAEAQRALDDVTASLSWRSTAPLRAALARARALRSR